MRCFFLALSALVLCLAACDDGEAIVPTRELHCCDLCEAGKQCPPPDTTPASADCYMICDDLDAINQASGCWDEFDRLYECFQLHGACGTECTSRRNVYSDCIAEHCSSDPNRDDCGL